MKDEVAILGSPSLTVLMVSADINNIELNVQTSELRRCVKVKVDVLGSKSLIDLMLSVDVKQH